MYTERFYREWVDQSALESFEVKIDQSDLLILCDQKLGGRAYEVLAEVREILERYSKEDPPFLTSLKPHPAGDGAPEIVKVMARAAKAFGVGPMAAVAGAVAEWVGKKLLSEGEKVIVENGGDIFARTDRPLRLSLYAGEESPFKDLLAFEVDARRGVGICTSSGVVGPSHSFGTADAVVAVSRDTACADAAATAIANRIASPMDVPGVVEEVAAREAERGVLTGFVVAAGDRIGIWGDLKVIPARDKKRRVQCNKA